MTTLQVTKVVVVTNVWGRPRGEVAPATMSVPGVRRFPREGVSNTEHTNARIPLIVVAITTLEGS